MKLPVLTHKIMSGYLAAATILFVALVAHFAHSTESDAREWVGHSREVRLKIIEARWALERGHRRALFELERTPSTFDDVERFCANLETETADNSTQTATFQAVRAQLARLREAVKEGEILAISALVHEVDNMLQLASEVESQLLEQRIERRERRKTLVRFAIWGGASFAFLFVVLSTRAMARELRTREQLLVQIATANDRLTHKEAELAARLEELQRTNTSLEYTYAELDKFAYAASHDLKAPLRGIASLAQWVEDDLGAAVPLDAKKNLALLRGRVHRMEALVEGILAYSRAGRERLPTEKVDTTALVRETCDLLALPQNVQLSVGNLPVFDAERVPLQQMFLNLIGNAMKHGRNDAPEIEVNAEDAGDFVAFSVRDNGRGIDARYHERIFGMFQTLEARDRIEGTGIGLAIVRKLARAAGGKVWVESAPGKGAIFRFTWPKVAENDRHTGELSRA